MPHETAKKQISLDFDGTPACLCGCKEEHSHLPDDATNDSAEGVVLSFSEKLAQKEQENQSRLYDGILSRIKHLNS